MVTRPHLPALDPLTWLPNRVLFEARLVRAVRDVERRRGTLAVLLIDVDRMEQVNATLGRGFGDRILREAAGRMARTLHAGASLARLQSDDFAAFFEVEDLAAAAKQAARLLERCREPYVVDCLALTVTASIGIALHGRDADGPAALLARAERALNQAKIRGRDRFYPGAAEPAS
jgi:diguanylate cyclase (GGDEF)-like protein